MTGRRRLGIVAAAATLLSAAPLTTIFQSYTWLAQCILTVGLICGAGPLLKDTAARFEERFPFPIRHGYGLSETSPVATSNS